MFEISENHCQLATVVTLDLWKDQKLFFACMEQIISVHGIQLNTR